MKKVAFICPFNLDNLTGTPIRTKSTVSVVSKYQSVLVFATSGKKFKDEIPVFEVGGGGIFHFSKKIFKALKENKPDVLHGVTTLSMLPMFLYKFFYRPKTKIILEMHGWAWSETKGEMSLLKRLIFLFLDLLGLWGSNAIIAMSHKQKNFLSKLTLSPKRIHVLWGPVDFPIEYTDPIPHENFVVGYIGNSSKWQGLPYLIGAAKELQNDSSIHFKLGGFRPENEKEFPKLSNVEYSGKIPPTDVVKYLHSCDVLVSSRLQAKVSDLQYPHKLSGYLASGRPVIVSNTNDQKEIIEENNCGKIADPLSVETIVKAIREIKNMSPEERKGMGQRAAEFAKKHFGLEEFAQKFKNIYNLL